MVGHWGNARKGRRRRRSFILLGLGFIAPDLKSPKSGF
jgi:hypothetical protein